MLRLPNNIDIHTHTGAPRCDAVLCVDPTQCDKLPEGDGMVSVGIHPWNAHLADDAVWARLASWLNDSRVVAVGEIGLDRCKGPEEKVQDGVFRRQAELAAALGLPVVIHCVRATDRLLALRKSLQGANQWIYHGFRGKPETAQQLLDAGIDLSFGDKFNSDAFQLTPSHRRYRETD